MSTTTASVLAEYPARYFAAWNDQELEKVESILAVDGFSWIDPSLPAELTDLEGAHGFFQAAWQGFPDMSFEMVGPPMVDEEASRVSQEWVMRGTHTGEGFPPGVPPTGNSFEVPGTDIWEVDADGRATMIRAYYDAATLARQLGLIE